MTERERDYWFRAKRYGWGWGLPLTWQGWFVLVGWCVGVILGSLWLAPKNQGQLLLFLGFMTVLLIAICWAKGEPPRWRWGDDDKDR